MAEVKAPPLVGYFVPLRAFCLGCGGMVAFRVALRALPSLNATVCCDVEGCRYKGHILTVDVCTGQVIHQADPEVNANLEFPAEVGC